MSPLPFSALFLLFVYTLPLLSDEFSPDSITSLMRKVAAYSFRQFGEGTAAGLDNDWSRGTIMTGIMGLYRVTGEKQWLDSIDNWGDRYGWTWKNNGSADNHCCMQTYCERYLAQPVPANAGMYQPSLANINSMMRGPGHALWGWQDAMYMSPPVWSMIGAITGQQIYYDSLTSFWWDNVRHLYDTTWHLWYWADETPWYLTPQGFPKFWGPGNAWVIGGMVRCMYYMPDTYSQRPRWIALFREFCDALKSRQQPDGMWRTSLYEPTEYPDAEASCTAFFVYAFSLGVHWGILDPVEYLPVIRKAWTPLVNCVWPSGMVGRCQPWNHSPGGAGMNNNTPEGQGAFLLAAEGMNLVLQQTAGTAERGRIGGAAPIASTPIARTLIVPRGREVSFPAGVRHITVFSLTGKKIWERTVSGTTSAILPDRISQGATCLITYDR